MNILIFIIFAWIIGLVLMNILLIIFWDEVSACMDLTVEKVRKFFNLPK